MAVARHREYNPFHPCFPAEGATESMVHSYPFFDSDYMKECSSDDMVSASPAECDIWSEFGKHCLTPPESPRNVKEISTDYCKSTDGRQPLILMSEIYEKIEELKPNVFEDCMWSGVERRRTGRVRNVSLSELNMVTTSTSCVDPTTFTAYPRQHNQVEHNYSLATPEPMRVPKLHSETPPSTTDDSESDEEPIDVVTVDTRAAAAASASHTYSKHNFSVRHNLQAVAQKLSTQAYKRSRCSMYSNEYPPPKKIKQWQPPSNFSTSSNSSDSEDYSGKRCAHNVMERHRRNELKTSLMSLRDSLPSLADKDRAAKVIILSHATQYMQELRLTESALSREHRRAKDENVFLKRKLADLHLQVNLLSC